MTEITVNTDTNTLAAVIPDTDRVTLGRQARVLAYIADQVARKVINRVTARMAAEELGAI